ncbi:MAG TPA: S-layer homology domain-containing protein [Vicinamibacterales bacterium]|nr:S-layer homology domain-containing protein [Vicinamibacterales bacterium]
MRAPALAIVGIVLGGLAACAPKPAPVVTVAPRYPAFMFPGVPPELGADPALVARHDAAWQRLQAGELREAERDFKWVTERSGAFFPSQTGLGYVALAGREFREALLHFELGLAVAPWYVPAMAGRGEALLGLGRRQEAIASFEAVLAANPSMTELRSRVDALRFRAMEDEIGAARRARDVGRFDEAAAAYERAISASPESGFLYRELAAAEQRLGRNDAALAHARKAIELDATDARAHLLAGEILEAQRQFAAALAEYEAAAALEPGEEIQARIESARERAALANLPPEFQAIQQEPSITRGELAALIGVRLDDLIQQARRREAPVMTDTRGHWAAPWIGSVIRAGIMDPYPNHTFQPHARVRRAELALAVSRLLGVLGTRNPRALQQWREARPRFGDLPTTHLGYPAAALSVGAEILEPLEGNTFQPGRPVSGAEALEALERIDALWRGRPARAGRPR